MWVTCFKDVVINVHDQQMGRRRGGPITSTMHHC